MWNINAPQGRTPCAILRFSQNLQFVPHFRTHYVLKFRWICSRGYGVMVVLSWRVWLSPNFQRLLAAELCVTPPKVLETHERARGLLSSCQVWWGSDFTRRRGGQKPWVFVCLSVCPSHFWMSHIVQQISPWRHWSTQTISIPLDKGRFVDVHRVQLSETAANWRHH